MECACISESGVEPSELIVEKKALAARPYKCCECGEEIPAGTEYWKETARDDGIVSHYKTCLDCLSVREHLFCDFFFTKIWSTIQDFIEDYPEDIPWARIGRLTPTARNKVCEMIEAEWARETAE